MDRIEKKKIVKEVLLFAVYIFIFVYLIRYIDRNADIMHRIAGAPIPHVAIGLISSALCIALAGMLDISCASIFGTHIRFGEAVGLSFTAAMVNLILPLQMGSVIKAMYFKKRTALAYTKYVSIVSGTIIINLMIALAQLIVCLAVSASQWDVNRKLILILLLFFTAIGACLTLMFVFRDALMKNVPFKKISLPILKGFFALLKDRRVICLVIVNLIMNNLLGCIRFCLFFQMLGFRGGVLDSVLCYGVYSASSLIPILPGNIGISEVLVGFMNSVLGSEFDVGVAVVMINRVCYYIVAIIGALIAAWPVWRAYHE